VTPGLEERALFQTEHLEMFLVAFKVCLVCSFWFAFDFLPDRDYCQSSGLDRSASNSFPARIPGLRKCADGLFQQPESFLARNSPEAPVQSPPKSLLSQLHTQILRYSTK
jgi:hypothetical protein